MVRLLIWDAVAPIMTSLQWRMIVSLSQWYDGRRWIPRTKASNTESSQQQASITLQWRHNKRDSVSNHQPHDSLLKLLLMTSSWHVHRRYTSQVTSGIIRWKRVVERAVSCIHYKVRNDSARNHGLRWETANVRHKHQTITDFVRTLRQGILFVIHTMLQLHPYRFLSIVNSKFIVRNHSLNTKPVTRISGIHVLSCEKELIQVSRFKCTPLKINSPVNLQQPVALQSDSPSHCIMTPQSFCNNWFALQNDSPFWKTI